MTKLKLIVILICTLILVPVFGETSSQPIPSGKYFGGINHLEEVDLGGVKQWILVRGEKMSNPILLFLHGGPGFPEMPFTHIDSTILEKHFLVVNWDQRGTGKSFNTSIPEKSLNFKQILTDTHDLIQFLRERFSKDKIFLIGHSWGSILGLHIAKNHPEYLHAYIGMGQVVNMKQGELLSYQYTVKKADAALNENDQKLLKKIGPPSTWENIQSMFVQRQLLEKYGGSFRNISYMDLGRYWMSSPYYSEADKNNLMKAFIYVQNIMWDNLSNVNMIKEVPELTIPVFFFLGEYDYQTPFKLVERYFKVLKSPYKKIVRFKNSGHSPNLDEPDLYQDRLINLVLKSINFKKADLTPRN